MSNVPNKPYSTNSIPPSAPSPEPVPDQDVEQLLRVGKPVILATGPLGDSCGIIPGRILGWSRDRFILVELETLSYQSRVFNTSRSTLMRFMVDGRACALRIRILNSRLTTQDIALKVGWPEDVRCSVIRSERRLHLELPCTVVVPGGLSVPGTIRNLSRSGCGMYVPVAIKAGVSLTCSFVLPNGTPFQDLKCEVRHTELEAEGSNVGCAFADLEPALVRRLEFSVESSLLHRDKPESAMLQVVVLSRPNPALDALQARLKKKNVEARVVHDPLHAFAWLATLPAAALFIDAFAYNLPIADFCRIVKTSPECSRLPIYVVGANAVAESCPGCAGAITSFDGIDKIVDSLPRSEPSDAAEQ